MSAINLRLVSSKTHNVLAVGAVRVLNHKT
jgi:hypothetical protein